MQIALKALGLMVSCVLFAPGSAGASDATPEKPKPEASIKREELRYDSKSFDEWRRILLTELKPERRVEALKAVRAFAGKGYGTEAAEAAIAVMADYVASEFPIFDERGDNVANAASEVIAKVGAAAHPALLRALKGGNKNQRLFALGELRERDLPVPVVTDLTLYKDADVRTRALGVLMDRYPEKGVLASLSRPLKHEDAEIRCDALSQIIGHSRWDDSLLKLVLPSLRDKEEAVRLAVLDALTNGARERLPSLFRRETAPLTGFLDGSKEVPGLVVALRDPSPKVREKAVELLTPFIPHSTQIAQAMREACKDPDPDVRKAATKALVNPTPSDSPLKVIIE